MFHVNSVLCSVLVLVVSARSQTQRTILYNSSDLSYLSNGIQFPVPAQLEADFAEDHEKMPDLKWLATLFDHHGWSKRLEPLENRHCAEETRIYLENLKNGTSWATKSQYLHFRTFSRVFLRVCDARLYNTCPLIAAGEFCEFFSFFLSARIT